MKLKLPNWLLIVDILTLFLIGAILLIPDSWVRIVLGLPFLLFFPGFVLIEALFVRRASGFSPSLFKRGSAPPYGPSDVQRTTSNASSSPSSETSHVERQTSNAERQTSNVQRPTSNISLTSQNSQGMDSIERVALSFGMSIAVTALIGLGLNYTPWGIRLLPVLFSISAFIIILSGVALIRQYRLNSQWDWMRQYTLKMPGWEGSRLNKALTIILVIAILGAVGTLIYTVAMPKVGERFTEFYILGLQGKAETYPADFAWDNNRQIAVSTQYGKDSAPVTENYGRVTLGIINQEQQKTTYAVEIKIDGQLVNVMSQGQSLACLEGIELVQGQKWEGEIGFAPQHTGQNQKVEFLLYKDGGFEVYNSLHLWINVIEQK